MALEVWYKSDIQNALRAAEHVVDATADAMDPRDAPYADGFLAGYRAALATIALAFGLHPAPEDRGALPPDGTVVAWTSPLPATVASVHARQGER